MRFVLGNRLMTRAGGTEVHLLTLGSQLVRLGHSVAVYSPELGPFGDYVRDQGLNVVGQLRALPESCDVVLSQDGIVASELRARFPDALHVFRICGDVYDFQAPPQIPGLIDLIVVLSDRYRQLAEATAVQVPVVRLRMPIDVDRLIPVGRPQPEPRQAIVLGNYGDRLELVRRAWEPRGVSVSTVGGDNQRFDLAAALAGSDVVVAKSRAALDAMACGRAVYVLDVFGGDGWVTPELYTALEADQFAGQASGRVIDVRELSHDLDLYEPAMGATNRDLILQHHDARQHTLEFLAAIAGHAPPAQRAAPDLLQEVSRLTALGWSWQLRRLEMQKLADELHSRLVEAVIDGAELERLRGVEQHSRTERAELERVRGQLDRITGSIWWRVGSRLRRLRARWRRERRGASC